MPTDAKRATVERLTTLLTESSSSIVTDYRGLTVGEIGAVRRSLREQGIRYHVVKNRLARIAAEEAGVGELSPLLEGPTAIAVGLDDEARLAKAFLDAVRPREAVISSGLGNRYGHPTPRVLAALLERGIAVHRTDRDGPARFVCEDGLIRKGAILPF